MKPPFKLRYQNEIVGLFVLGALAVVVTLVFLTARSKQWFEETFPCEIRFRSGSVALVADGMDVRIRSQLIGRVVSSRYDESGRVVVTAALVTRYQKAIREDTEAVLYAPIAGLPGEPYIELKGGKSPTPVHAGSVLSGHAAEDLLQLATDVLTDTQKHLGPTLREVHRLSERVNLALDAMSKDSDPVKMAEAFADLAKRMQVTLLSVERIIGGLERVITAVERGDGLASHLLSDPKLVQEVKSLVMATRSAASGVSNTLRLADGVVRRTGRLVEASDDLMKASSPLKSALPALIADGQRTLKDLAVVTSQLRKVAPHVPSLASQVDEVLLETRGVLGAAEKHWLFTGALRPSKPAASLPLRGLRDTPTLPADADLRKLLEQSTTAKSPGSPR